MKQKKRILGSLFKDFPHVVLAILFILGAVLGFWVVEQEWAQGPIKSTELFNTYVLIATVAGIAGAFAGVVLTFGLGGDGKGFRIFRKEGGKSLIDNWLSLVMASFGASGIALLSAILFSFGQFHFALIAAMTSLFILLHLVGRTIWLMGELVRVVQGDDALQKAAEDRKKHGRFRPPPIDQS